MRILVTGANGYLGQGIVKAIIESGNKVIATDFKLDNVDTRATKIECDIFSIEDPYEYFEKPDALLHLAWRDGFIHYSDAHIVDFPKHYELIKKMAESGLKHIAVMGSMHEIGFFEGSINEKTPCHPTTPYGIAKNALRELTEMICKQNNIVFQWLRGYYIVGNSKYGSSIFSKITAAVEEGKKEFPFTLGQNQYDFIDYVEFDKYAKSFCNQKGIRLVRLCLRVDQVVLPGKAVVIPEVNDYIRLIRDATYVLTDSFHAVSFCLNLEKQFYVYYPNKYAERLKSILLIMELTDRELMNNDYDRIYMSIPFKNIKFKPLSIEDTAKLYDKSKIVIDYTTPSQTGLSMRTIECLGHECKIITNNKNIKFEKFYSEENVFIYDDNVKILPEFIEKPYKKNNDEVMYYYSIKGWIDTILGED